MGSELETIYRTHCVQCGQVKEFRSGRAARSHINEHQRNHDHAPTNWSTGNTHPKGSDGHE